MLNSWQVLVIKKAITSNTYVFVPHTCPALNKKWFLQGFFKGSGDDGFLASDCCKFWQETIVQGFSTAPLRFPTDGGRTLNRSSELFRSIHGLFSYCTYLGYKIPCSYFLEPISGTLSKALVLSSGAAWHQPHEENHESHAIT